MKTTHTPEPWKADGYEVRQPSGRIIADFGPHHTPPAEYPLSCKLEDEANAQRAVACVNACRNINPEAVPELLKALIRAVAYLDANRPKGRITKIFAKLNEHENDVLKPARAALAKAQSTPWPPNKPNASTPL